MHRLQRSDTEELVLVCDSAAAGFFLISGGGVEDNIASWLGSLPSEAVFCGLVGRLLLHRMLYLLHLCAVAAEVIVDRQFTVSYFFFLEVVLQPVDNEGDGGGITCRNLPRIFLAGIVDIVTPPVAPWTAQLVKNVVYFANPFIARIALKCLLCPSHLLFGFYGLVVVVQQSEIDFRTERYVSIDVLQSQ